MENFKFADASIIGTMHDQMGRNNQDFGYLAIEDRYAVGVVADGCGSTITSEVGATLGAQWCAEYLRNILLTLGGGYMMDEDHALAILIRMAEFVMTRIHHSIDRGSFSLQAGMDMQLLQNNFLFTLVGFIIDNETNSLAFSIGDGYIRVNNEEIFMEEANNAPTYIAYSLTPERNKWDLVPKIRYFIPTKELKHLVVATDGMQDFAECEGKPFPGKIQEMIPSLEEVLNSEKYFTNPAQLQRLLAKMNPITRPSARAHGLLRDDTTIIIAKRFDE